MRVTTLAGAAAGLLDGAGATARFNNPQAIAVDSSGTAYVCDAHNHCIRRLSPDGVVTVFAGGAGQAGFQDGPGSTAKFNSPRGIVVAFGGVLVADTANHRIRKIDGNGTVTTFAGTGAAGAADGDVGTGTFHTPVALAFDELNQRVYVVEQGTHLLRVIDENGSVALVAGNGSAGGSNGVGPSIPAFHTPSGVACDGTNVYVACAGHHTIRRVVLATSMVTNLAGSAGSASFADGAVAAARFHTPHGLACDGDGNVVVCDFNNGKIRSITPAGVVSTLAGAAARGHADGPAATAAFHSPCGVCIDAQGNILLSDLQKIRRIAGAVEPPVVPHFGPAAVAKSTLVEDLDSLLAPDAGTLHDMELTTGNFALRAHRCIVAARCPSLRAQAISGTSGIADTDGTGGGGAAAESQGADAAAPPKPVGKNKKIMSVRLENTTPEALTAVVRFLYTGTMDVPDPMLVDVLLLSSQLGIQRLYKYCESQTQTRLDNSNAIKWFILADQHKLVELRLASLEHIGRHFRRIRRCAPTQVQLLAAHPTLMMEIMMTAMV